MSAPHFVNGPVALWAGIYEKLDVVLPQSVNCERRLDFGQHPLVLHNIVRPLEEMLPYLRL